MVATPDLCDSELDEPDFNQWMVYELIGTIKDVCSRKKGSKILQAQPSNSDVPEEDSSGTDTDVEGLEKENGKNYV